MPGVSRVAVAAGDASGDAGPGTAADGSDDGTDDETDGDAVGDGTRCCVPADHWAQLISHAV
jgi:hypothetical protein